MKIKQEKKARKSPKGKRPLPGSRPLYQSPKGYF